MTFFESLIIQGIVNGLGIRMWSDTGAPQFGEIWEEVDMERRRAIEYWCDVYGVDSEKLIEAMRRP